MNFNRYRWCVVSCCTNTSVKTPEKLFMKVPDNIEMRNVWLELAKRDPNSLSIKSRLYLCEDHFNLEQDMENYMEYKIMGSVKYVKMKVNCTPSRFCFHNETKCKLSPPETQRLDFIQGAGNSKLTEDFYEPTASSSKSDILILQTEKNTVDKETPMQKLTTDKSIQVHVLHDSKLVQANISAHYSSKSTQIRLKIRDQYLSPIKSSVSIATSQHIKVGEIDKPSTYIWSHKVC